MNSINLYINKLFKFFVSCELWIGVVGSIIASILVLKTVSLILKERI